MAMRKAKVLICTLALSGLSLLAQDADLAAYQTLMKSAAGNAGAARKALAADDTAGAAAKAKAMSADFDKIAAWFKAKGKDDGAKFAEAASKAGMTAAAATSKDDMMAAMAKVNPNCGGCHAVYRDGNKFKGM
jgi:hypothetical protein